MRFLGTSRYYGDAIDDRTLPWDPIWAYVLGEDDEQSRLDQRSRGVMVADSPDPPAEPVTLSEPEELTRRPSFWRRRAEFQQEQTSEEQAEILDGDATHLSQEYVQEERDVEERWTWELDSEVFSFGSGPASERAIEPVSDTEATPVVVPVRRWRSLRNIHDHCMKNMGVFASTSIGRKLTPAVVGSSHDSPLVDDARDEQEASTWHLELDKEALGFGNDASTDGGDNNDNEIETKSLNGWRTSLRWN